MRYNHHKWIEFRLSPQRPAHWFALAALAAFAGALVLSFCFVFFAGMIPKNANWIFAAFGCGVLMLMFSVYTEKPKATTT